VLDKTPTPFTAPIYIKNINTCSCWKLIKICISSQNSPTEPKPVEMALKTPPVIKIVIHD
jgi:hypothetical protein